MMYKNGEMKVDQLIGYFNASKVRLIPAFQRGTVWPRLMRQRLIENMLKRRPIPAIFVYKDPDGGPTFTYNILDGKQRLETLLLFIGDRRPEILAVKNLRDYFWHRPSNPQKKGIRSAPTTAGDLTENFSVMVDKKSVTFADLSPELLRPFVDYAIPVIEIDMDEDRAASWSELTQLFMDINPSGKKVTRFQISQAVKDE